MPRLLALSCNHCGAPLDVRPRAKYVTCEHCETRLRVMQTESPVYTKAVEEVVKEVADDVAVLELQGELDRIDRKWEKRRESFMLTDENGQKHVPSTVNTVAAAAFGGLFLLVWMGIALSNGVPIEMAMIVAAGTIVVGVGGTVVGFGKVREYEQEKVKYTRRRREKYRELRAAKQAAS